MSLITDLAREDFLWDAIVENIHNSRPSRSADFNVNCPMCVKRGERRPDTRHRCGITKMPDGFAVNCFNCKFATRWSYGGLMSSNLRDFMSELGVPDLQLRRMAHRLHAISRTLSQSSEAYEIIGERFLPDFNAMALPAGARPLHEWVAEGCSDPLFFQAVQYIYGRGTDIAEGATYYWTPIANATKASETGSDRMNERIIIPFYFKGRIVGYSARGTAGDVLPKYWSRIPADYIFNNEVLEKRERKYAFIVEGPTDAIGIGGAATLGSKLSEKQAAWIKSSGRTPILVSDRDRAGMLNIEHALRHGWGVAFPRLSSHGWWDSDVNDCGKAVEKYGKLYVIRSILETVTFDSKEIEVRRRLFV